MDQSDGSVERGACHQAWVLSRVAVHGLRQCIQQHTYYYGNMFLKNGVQESTFIYHGIH